MNLRFFNSFYSLIALAIPTQTYSSPFNFFQQRPGDKGNGNCHNTGNLYADALVASHASYHAFRSFEHAARHPNPASFLANPLHLVQIEDAVVCHRDRGDRDRGDRSASCTPNAVNHSFSYTCQALQLTKQGSTVF